MLIKTRDVKIDHSLLFYGILTPEPYIRRRPRVLTLCLSRWQTMPAIFEMLFILRCER